MSVTLTLPVGNIPIRYGCVLTELGNSGVLSQNLTVTNNVPGANGLSQAKTQDFNITVTMPDDLACTGGKIPPSTGIYSA